MKKLQYLIILLLPLFSCEENNISNEYTSYDTLQISFNKPILEGQWMEMDGLKFLHSMIDTGLSTNQTKIYIKTTDNDNLTILPTSENYILLEGSQHWFRQDLNNYQMATAFINALSKVEEKNLTNGIKPKYQFVGNPYFLYEGQVNLTRTDGNPIKVHISDKYGAIISSL